MATIERSHLFLRALPHNQSTSFVWLYDNDATNARDPRRSRTEFDYLRVRSRRSKCSRCGGGQQCFALTSAFVAWRRRLHDAEQNTSDGSTCCHLDAILNFGAARYTPAGKVDTARARGPQIAGSDACMACAARALMPSKFSFKRRREGRICRQSKS